MEPTQIKQLREEHGLSQENFGLKLGMPKTTAGRNVRAYELGERPVPATLKKLLVYVKKFGFVHDETKSLG